MTHTGISLDPVYTLKGVRGMLGEMTTNPARFQGKRVLFIHTGKGVGEMATNPAEGLIDATKRGHTTSIVTTQSAKLK